jgi:hypothetical protein
MKEEAIKRETLIEGYYEFAAAVKFRRGDL